MINRYYDPATDQFLSIDPMVDQTGQPYVFTNDNPLNTTDPSGLLAAFSGGGGAVSSAEAITVAMTLYVRALQSEGASVGAGLVDTIAKELNHDLSRPSMHIGDEELVAIERELSDSLGKVAGAAAGLQAVALGLDDLSQGKGVLYSVADAVGTTEGAWGGAILASALCGGPEDGVGLVCGFFGALIGGQAFQNLYHALFG